MRVIISMVLFVFGVAYLWVSTGALAGNDMTLLAYEGIGRAVGLSSAAWKNFAIGLLFITLGIGILYWRVWAQRLTAFVFCLYSVFAYLVAIRNLLRGTGRLLEWLPPFLLGATLSICAVWLLNGKTERRFQLFSAK